jgi:hypothetical protein
MNRNDLSVAGDLAELHSNPTSSTFAVMTEEGNQELERVDEDEVKEISQSKARASTSFKEEFDRVYAEDALRFVVVYDPDEAEGKMSKLLDKLMS